jgi:hypothetical protein
MLKPCSTASNACSLVKGSSNRTGHGNDTRCMGSSALYSPCADGSPDDGRDLARSRSAEDGDEVTSIMLTTDSGVERADALEIVSGVGSETHSASAPVLGGRLTIVAVTVCVGVAFAPFDPETPHRSNEVRSRPRSLCIPRRRMMKMMDKKTTGAKCAAARNKDVDDHGGSPWPRGRGVI